MRDGVGEWAVVASAGMISTVVHHSAGGLLEDSIKYVGNDPEEVGLDLPPEDGLWLFIVDSVEWETYVGDPPDYVPNFIGKYLKVAEWPTVCGDLVKAKLDSLVCEARAQEDDR